MSRLIMMFLFSTLLAACGADTPPPPANDAPAPVAASRGVDGQRIAAADDEPQNWLSHGRSYDEQRYSPLTAISDQNVSELGLAWYVDLPTKRGVEATPLVIDGVMYTTGAWSIVYAIDARSGSLLWTFDPKVDRAWGRYACCDAVNRGVAAWGDRIFVGTLDGYLVAIDATTGEQAWRVNTIDRTMPYTITGAPRIIKGKVMIGNGGAEMGVRGYVSAYDAETGELAWRFHTVPGNPADGFESDAMAAAAETWKGEWWRYGGGGTVWDSMAYDPELDLLYIGVGNGSPWNQKIRSPGGGDNLYLSSIVALDPDDGSHVWHYQTTPGETWDYTATQHMILADMEIAGRERKVLMQAPKNGFFYVLDRTDGSLISAENYAMVNWATGIDPESGRPIEAPDARYPSGPRLTFPAPFGGHNWHPMAFSPDTGLVYIPAQDVPFVYADAENFEFAPGFWNAGVEFEIAASPEDPASLQMLAGMVRGRLSAWDPVTQREVWRFEHAGPWNGGALATAGNLVFQGSLIGEFAAYKADTGERLWAYPTQTGVAAAPVTYAIDGEQYVTIMVGWGTVFALAGGPLIEPIGLENRSRVLTFRLGATGTLPDAVPTPDRLADLPATSEDKDLVALGKNRYYDRCWQCHGDGVISGGVIPDLRHLAPETRDQWDAIVLGGLRAPQGMPAFAGILTAGESAAIHAYVRARTRAAQSSD